MKTIETCFSPALFNYYKNNNNTVIIIDVLRATTSICSALAAGASKIIPISEIEDIPKFKQIYDNTIIAAEREGIKISFADLDNSPTSFKPELVKNKTILYSTTNGTRTIKLASKASKLLLASFANLNTVISFLLKSPDNLLLLCSGYKNQFSLEDTLCAGAIASELLKSNTYSSNCDATYAAIDLWNLAKNNLIKYTEKASHRLRLKNKIPFSVIEYCLTPNTINILPVYNNGEITNLLF